jgi:hypothetical protein
MKSPTLRAAHVVCLASALLIPAASALAQGGYALDVLYGLDTAGTNIAIAINNAGAVVGATTTFDSSTQLYKRSAWLLVPGNSTPLGFAPPAGYSATMLNAINNNGVVAGFNFEINQSYPHGNSVFSWSPSNGSQTLATPASAYSSYVSGLNDAGSAVGFIETTPLVYSAVVWDATGHASTLAATPSGPTTFANYINNNGQMLVTGADSTSSRDYVWDSQTGYTVLANAPGFSQSVGVALNDGRHGVGYATNDLFGYSGHAIFWSDPQHVVDIGVLAGDASSLAYSVNASDLVVGVSSSALVGAPPHGFLWSADTGMVDLLSLLDPADPLRSHISNLAAYDINDAGQIVGSLSLDGVQRAFVLTPVPEPASWAMLLAGGGCLFGLRGRRRSPACS